MDTHIKKGRQRGIIPAFLAVALGAIGIAPPVAVMASHGDVAARDAALRQLGERTPRPERQVPPRSVFPVSIRREDDFGGLGTYPRQRGFTPKDWGMSQACARMVRKNKLRKLGISGQRI